MTCDDTQCQNPTGSQLHMHHWRSTHWLSSDSIPTQHTMPRHIQLVTLEQMLQNLPKKYHKSHGTFWEGMYVCMHVCMCVYVCVCMCVCVYECMRVSLYVCICVCVYVCVWIYYSSLIKPSNSATLHPHVASHRHIPSPSAAIGQKARSWHSWRSCPAHNFWLLPPAAPQRVHPRRRARRPPTGFGLGPWCSRRPVKRFGMDEKTEDL